MQPVYSSFCNNALRRDESRRHICRGLVGSRKVSTHTIYSNTVFLPQLVKGSIAEDLSKHLMSDSTRTDVWVECVDRFSQRFLASVALHSSFDEIGDGPCCACIFSEPLLTEKRLGPLPTFILTPEFSIPSSPSPSPSPCDESEKNDSLILAVNSAASRLMGQDCTKRFVPKRAVQHSGFCFPDSLLQFMRHTMANNQPTEGPLPSFSLERLKVQTTHQNGEGEIWLSATFAPIGRTVGGRSLFLMEAQDVTQRQRLEEKWERHRTAAFLRELRVGQTFHDLRALLATMQALSSLLPSSPRKRQRNS